MNQLTILKELKSKLMFSYSPYSTVKVAAAVEYELNGEKHIAYGVNVENVSYGLTICAERSAVSNALINGMKNITALYVVSNQTNPVTPCGACRQVVCEFMGNTNAPVLCINEDESQQWVSNVGALLPNKFKL